MVFKKYLFLLFFCFSFFNNHLLAQNWEVKLLDQINPQNPNDPLLIGVSNSVYPLAIGLPVSMIATGLITKNKNVTKNGLNIVTTLLVNTAITQGLKYSIKRQRPYEAFPLLINASQNESDASFPSGHTSTAFSMATTISFQYKKWYIVLPAYLWATTVGYSRLYLGVHYPSDVFAGALIGVGSVYINNWLQHQIIGKKKTDKKAINF